MEPIDSLRESTDDFTAATLGVQLADTAFFQGVALVLEQLKPGAIAEIKEHMTASVLTLTSAHKERTKQAAQSRAAWIAALLHP